MNYIYLSYPLWVSGLVEASATWRVTMEERGGEVLGYRIHYHIFPPGTFFSSKAEIDMSRAQDYKRKDVLNSVCGRH